MLLSREKGKSIFENFQEDVVHIFHDDDPEDKEFEREAKKVRLDLGQKSYQ